MPTFCGIVICSDLELTIEIYLVEGIAEKIVLVSVTDVVVHLACMHLHLQGQPFCS